MARNESRTINLLALPALVWAFAIEQVTARRRGLPPRITGGQVTVAGDDWHFGTSDDAKSVVVLHERSARSSADGERKILRLNEEKGELLPISKATWPDNSPDAKKLAEKQKKANARLKAIEVEITAIQRDAEEAGTERLELPLEELNDLMAGTVRLLPPEELPAAVDGEESADEDADQKGTGEAAGAIVQTIEPVSKEAEQVASEVAHTNDPIIPVDGGVHGPSGYTVPGLSAGQMEALSEAFPTVEELKAASDEELSNVSGIGKAAVATIKEWLAKPDAAAEGAAS